MLVCRFKGSGFKGSWVKKQQNSRGVLSFKKKELPDIRTHEPETQNSEPLNPEPLNPIFMYNPFDNQPLISL
jgi:hypothetical protein